MTKKLASRTTKEILLETELKDKGVNKADFSPTWQGRIYVLNPEQSGIAAKLNLKKQGEFAIKVR